jgi:biopolymer transport protein ExbD
MQTGKDGEGMHEVNVVPLIDVSLVLVVILMLLTPLASESSIGVHKARSEGTSTAEPAEPVILAIPDDANVVVKGVAVPRSDLATSLTPLLAGANPPPVVVVCADGVTHGSFVNVLDIAKLCGAKAIAVADGGQP